MFAPPKLRHINAAQRFLGLLEPAELEIPPRNDAAQALLLSHCDEMPGLGFNTLLQFSIFTTVFFASAKQTLQTVLL